MSELKHINTFATFSQRLQAQNEEKKIQEKTGSQKEYADFFLKLLQEFDVSSPNELDDNKKKEFFDKLSKGWDKGVTTAGQKMVEESVLNEEEINSDDEFKEYAIGLLKKAHGDKFEQSKAESLIKDLLSKKGESGYGELVGMLQSSLK